MATKYTNLRPVYFRTQNAIPRYRSQQSPTSQSYNALASNWTTLRLLLTQQYELTVPNLYNKPTQDHVNLKSKVKKTNKPLVSNWRQNQTSNSDSRARKARRYGQDWRNRKRRSGRRRRREERPPCLGRGGAIREGTSEWLGRGYRHAIGGQKLGLRETEGGEWGGGGASPWRFEMRRIEGLSALGRSGWSWWFVMSFPTPLCFSRFFTTGNLRDRSRIDQDNTANSSFLFIFILILIWERHKFWGNYPQQYFN